MFVACVVRRKQFPLPYKTTWYSDRTDGRRDDGTEYKIQILKNSRVTVGFVLGNNIEENEICSINLYTV